MSVPVRELSLTLAELMAPLLTFAAVTAFLLEVDSQTPPLIPNSCSKPQGGGVSRKPLRKIAFAASLLVAW